MPKQAESPMSNSNVGRFMAAVGAVVEHPASGTILVLKRDAVDHKSGIWEIGYGRLEQGENPEAGLKREFKEETGLEIEVKEVLTTWFFYRGKAKIPENEVVGMTFWAVTDQQDVALSPEHSEYQWVLPEDALRIITEEQIKKDINAFLEAKEKEEMVEKADEQQKRAIADYKNLMRRTQQEKTAQAKLAAKNLVEDLLQPLEHLSMAAEQINDDGLSMVETQLWQVLSQHGLEEIKAQGKPFDVETMEAVEREGDGDIVVKVLRRGYKLHGLVLQHAKVVLGRTD